MKRWSSASWKIMPQRLRVSCSVFLLTSMASTRIRPVNRRAFMIASISVVLPAAVGPHQPDPFRPRHRQRDAAQGIDAVGVSHVQVVDLKQGGGHECRWSVVSGQRSVVSGLAVVRP